MNNPTTTTTITNTITPTIINTSFQALKIRMGSEGLLKEGFSVLVGVSMFVGAIVGINPT
jgi:hypothetical protein